MIRLKNEIEEILSRVNAECEKIPSYAGFLSYNVFRVLEEQEKEVIMCRFLADLLDPQGTHGRDPDRKIHEAGKA